MGIMRAVTMERLLQAPQGKLWGARTSHVVVEGRGTKVHLETER